MATRKKNQIPVSFEQASFGEEYPGMPPVQNLTAALTAHRQGRHTSLNGKSMSALVGFVAGIAGSVLGVLYVVPWYQTNILHQDPSAARVENRTVVIDEQSAVTTAVEKINPAVVSIVVTRDLPKLEQFGSPFGGFFFEAPSGETEKQQVGAGSGFIVSADGTIVTNKHVVSDGAAEYTVITKDGQKYPAKVSTADPFNDLAVVKIDAKDLPAAELGNSDQIKLGQSVIAIGNALGQFQNTVTIGVISGIGRNIVASGGAQTEKLSELIQTDAAINPGNSGGPLVNLDGQVIGVNTAVSQSAQLIGFAIPINQVKKVISDVKQYGHVRRPYLGVRYTIITKSIAESESLPRDYGALIVAGDTREEVAVVPGSPADQAGISEGDIILELDGRKITADQPLADLLRKFDPGDRVTLKIFSKGNEKTVLAVLGEAK